MLPSVVLLKNIKMKKVYLILLLFIFSFANEMVEVEGVYRNTGDIAPNEIVDWPKKELN